MNARRIPGRQRAFALVITLALLALLVLAVFALSALTRVGSQIAGTGAHRVQARQNALMGLNFALSQLQLHAGPDDSVTGTADIAPGTKAINSRWTGVWRNGNTTPRWLVSGEAAPGLYSPAISFDANRKVLTGNSADIVLVNSGTANTAATKYLAGDAVVVPRVVIPGHDAAGTLRDSGGYAYWVGDEGVKLSAALPGVGAPGTPAPPVHGVPGFVVDAWTPDPAKVFKARSYEQLVHAGATAARLRSNFHGLTLLHVGYLDYPVQRAGLININSAGPRLWQGVMATYNPGISPAAFATAMGRAAIWGPAGADKVAGGPFTSVAGFLDFHPEVQTAIADVSADLIGFKNAMRPWFTVRSDTFRIRAYGDAVNPADAARVESIACCEAIVQRVKGSETGEGRFVITYFRWLGPDDI